MEMAPDVTRLRALFEQPGLRWIMSRLAERLSRGRPLSGLIANAQAGADERRALDDLLGRHSTAGSRLSLDLATLEETLRAAGMAGCLEDAVVACRGHVENQRAQAERRRDEWETLIDAVRSRCAVVPALLGWVDALAHDGTLKRLSRGDVNTASNLMASAVRMVSRKPGSEVLLATLAAESAGDSHALDRGQPLATLCLRAISVLHGIDGQRSANARRKAWAAVGVIIDDLSAPVLTFNLRATPGSALAQVLEAHRQQSEPVFLTYRQLQSRNLFEPLDPAMRTVFICENPTVVSAAAREIGIHCRPLVCTNGRPASAVNLLLSQLRRAGAELRCHADFDWAGLRIIDQLIRDHTAIPWRMSAQEYLAAAGTVSLDPQPFTASWSPELPEAIRAHGNAVFEEQVIRSLLNDLVEDESPQTQR
ncbi:MAG TPA: TIGR02679 family protein [Haliangiales bacterium]|nr:TIGR02679 family protein [Haliangiales bacterium]